MNNLRLAWLCVLIWCGRLGVNASEIMVGGLQNWNMGLMYGQVNASVGDILVFNYDRGQHDVWQVRGPTCNFNGSRELAGLTKSRFRLRLTKPGVYHFACSVDGHCDSGMLLTVKVSSEPRSPMDPPPDSPANPVYMPVGEVEGTGNCTAPELVAGTNDTYNTQCISAGWPMKPGDVLNAFYNLPMPYPPGTLVAVLEQNATIIDDTGRAVPLSEIYVHHFFGDFRNVRGEGAEIRGSMKKKPLPEPYAAVFNSSVLVQASNRASNVHLLNTKGVLPMDLYPCIECWCDKEYVNPIRNVSDITGMTLSNVTENGMTRVEALGSALTRGVGEGKSYSGGTACCQAKQCPSALPPEPVTYHLQYNVTYRTLQDLAEVVPVSYYILDLVNGSIEYDVFRKPGIDFESLETIGPFDERCPQPDNYTLLRCTGHQHIGGRCMELYDVDTNSLICTSCPVYGNGTFDEVGNERGYVVEMTTDSLAQPRQMRPGQRVRLVSRYDASTDHFGVMSLFAMDLADWDNTCSGPAPSNESVFGPPHSRSIGTFFGYTVPYGTSGESAS